MSILHRPEPPEYQLITRQLALKPLDSSSCTTQLRKLMHIYKLPPALVLATGKTILVLTFFMHLKFDVRMFTILITGVLLLIGVVIFITFLDYLYR